MIEAGYKFSTETRKRMSLSKLRKPTKHWLGKKRVDMTGENHPYWKGEKISYRNLHRWVERKLGKPKQCEYCKKDGFLGHKIHWANKNRKYLRNLKDWIRLCAKCHGEYDKKRGFRNRKK